MEASAFDGGATIGVALGGGATIGVWDDTEEDVVTDACVHNPDPELVDLLFWETLDLTKVGFMGFGSIVVGKS
jgi:hypothetical protein